MAKIEFFAAKTDDDLRKLSNALYEAGPGSYELGFTAEITIGERMGEYQIVGTPKINLDHNLGSYMRFYVEKYDSPEQVFEHVYYTVKDRLYHMANDRFIDEVWLPHALTL